MTPVESSRDKTIRVHVENVKCTLEFPTIVLSSEQIHVTSNEAVMCSPPLISWAILRPIRPPNMRASIVDHIIL